MTTVTKCSVTEPTWEMNRRVPKTAAQPCGGLAAPGTHQALQGARGCWEAGRVSRAFGTSKTSSPGSRPGVRLTFPSLSADGAADKPGRALLVQRV